MVSFRDVGGGEACNAVARVRSFHLSLILILFRRIEVLRWSYRTNLNRGLKNKKNDIIVFVGKYW
jgi:hypothetical protein